MQPSFIWVDFSEPLSSLESVDNVGQLHIRISLIQKIIQLLQDFHDCGFKVVELHPLLMLELKDCYGHLLKIQRDMKTILTQLLTNSTVCLPWRFLYNFLIMSIMGLSSLSKSLNSLWSFPAAISVSGRYNSDTSKMDGWGTLWKTRKKKEWIWT